jgi:hypothetical protein
MCIPPGKILGTPLALYDTFVGNGSAGVAGSTVGRCRNVSVQQPDPFHIGDYKME